MQTHIHAVALLAGPLHPVLRHIAHTAAAPQSTGERALQHAFGRAGSADSRSQLSQTAHQSSSQHALQTGLQLGIAFSSLDTGAALQLLSPTAQPMLHSILFGEGVISDISAVLARRELGPGLSGAALLVSAGGFACSLLASAAVGATSGLASALLVRCALPQLCLCGSMSLAIYDIASQ